MIALPRSVRRAAKVSVGALAGGLACAVVAAGCADGAAVLARRPSLAMTMLVVAITALVVIAVIRRVQFAPPSARAQRVRKAQPGTRFSSDGVMPGICASLLPRRLRLGTEPINPAV